MRVVVTGAGGFLGIELVRAFAANPAIDLVACSSRSARTIHSLAKLEGDSNNRVSVVTPDFARDVDALSECDVLINGAFPRNSDGASMAQGLAYVADVVGAAERAGVGALVNVSSQSVYDSSRTSPALEGDPLVLDSAYSTAKYAVELMINQVCRSSAFIHLRLASLIGVAFEQRLVNKMLAGALRTGRLRAARTEQIFDFMDVRDAARAIATVVQIEAWHGNSMLNVGSSSPHTLTGIATIVQQVLMEQGHEGILLETAEGTSSGSSALDCSRLHRATGFAAMYDLHASVLNMYQNREVSPVE